MQKRIGPDSKGNKASIRSSDGGYCQWVIALADEKQIIKVKAADEHRTGLWERNPAHPDGEVFINGPRVVSVAQSPAVVEALIQGRIDYATDEDVAAWEEHQHKAAEREARVVAEKREMVIAEAKKRARELYIEAVGSDEGFEQVYKSAA
jgi:hypothetical protein